MPHDNRTARRGVYDHLSYRDTMEVMARNRQMDRAIGMWNWIGPRVCKYHGTTTCRNRLCRTIDHFYGRGGGARRDWMHGSTYPLYEIVGYLRSMANPKSALALEFAKRFAHIATAVQR